MTWLENYAGEYFATGVNPPRRGSSHPQVVPYEPMQASDGTWFILGVGSDNIWRKFCDLAGLGRCAMIHATSPMRNGCATVKRCCPRCGPSFAAALLPNG